MLPYGKALLCDAHFNKGTAFTKAERQKLGLCGLLPPAVLSMEQQVMRVLERLSRQPTALDKYIQLSSLQVHNETLFYRVVVDNLDSMMPLIYTPTVGQACQTFGHIYQRPQGLYISAQDRGQIRSVLQNWPVNEVRVIVVTDGERILGLGDLGAYGMGIPIGKLALYTACGGIDPSQCLPVMLDTGTNTQDLIDDALYTGLKMPRIRGEDYDDLVEEFITAVQDVFPKALIQFEDFANRNAFRLLEKYQNRACVFNDDIQGTGAVALAGLYAAMRILNKPLSSQKILFLGAGEAATGIARLIVEALQAEGLSETEACQHCWFVDSKGLVVQSRQDLNAHKQPYAHDFEPQTDFSSALQALQPTAIIGVSGQPGRFDQNVLQKMAEWNAQPIIFALSNPTSKAECTAEQAYQYTQGRAIFASGSPFKSVSFNGHTFSPGQGNNAYIFPGVGLGVMVAQASRITERMFFIAAKTLAEHVADYDLAQGRVYPSLSRIREVSAKIAEAVAVYAHEQGLAQAERPDDMAALIQEQMYEPIYQDYA